MQKTFPEDRLPILAPKAFADFSPQEFFDHTVSLYAPRSGGKSAPPKIKGKFVEKPTKGPKRPYGILELRNQTALGEKTLHLRFERSCVIPDTVIPKVAKLLLSSEELTKDFLLAKKFQISTCAPNSEEVKNLSLKEI